MCFSWGGGGEDFSMGGGGCSQKPSIPEVTQITVSQGEFRNHLKWGSMVGRDGGRLLGFRLFYIIYK